ncbi:MAG: HIT domain-containing protein [Candidatus Kerfeldbacteria bacterium]|nr:HIT domain-containing protein [Candidatus Kerfeldbacteria bacterium]
MTEQCIFCSIVQDAKPEVLIFRGKHIVAFHDISPKARVHVLVVPKVHRESLNAITPADSEMIAELFGSIPTIAEQLGIRHSGYKVAINTGADGGQVVPHLHIHVLGGEPLSSLV